MAKLYFRHGAMHSAKTLNLLAVAHNYKIQNKAVLLIKPALDTRLGAQVIKSRAGLSATADISIDSSMSLMKVLVDFMDKSSERVYCILVDESQFLSCQNIQDLRDFSIVFDIPVICYGLRTDFATNLFEGSKRLLELADSIEEVKTTCFFCNKKAVCNLRHSNGVAIVDGPSVLLGGEETYSPVCYPHYKQRIDEVRNKPLN